MKKTLLNILKSPHFYAFILILFSVLFVFTHGNDYGLIWDSSVQTSYGENVYVWYKSHGRDTNFLNMQGNLAQHGPFVETLETAIYHHLDPQDPWPIRNIVTGIFGIVGIVAVYLIGIELGFPWVGLIASLMLILMPRYFGDAIINSKDIPFAAFLTLGFWAFLHLLNQWNKHYIKESILLGVILGITNSIRITSIMLYAYLATVVSLFVIYEIYTNRHSSFSLVGILRRAGKYALSIVLVVGISYVVMILTWPYVFLNPINNLVYSIQVMAQFPWDGEQIFQGHLVHATQFPRYYVPLWMLISTPIATIILFFVGMLFVLKNIIKKESKNIPLIISAGYVIFLFAFLIITKPNLSDAIRQVLFLLPPIVVIAGYGVWALFLLFKKKKNILSILLLGVVVIGYIPVAYTMFILHPYEYVYFNELVGGLKGAYGEYETDYYGACVKNSVEWLDAHYKSYTKSPAPFVFTQADMSQYRPYVLPNFILTNNPVSDFYIYVSPSIYNKQLANTKVIYNNGRFGVPLCQVLVRTKYK